LPNILSNFSIAEWKDGDLRYRSINHPDEIKAEPGAPLVVPISGFLDINGDLVAENDPSRHENRR